MKVWKAFAATYPNQPVDALKRKHHVIARPNMRLGDYIKPLISPSFQWVTFLSLGNVACVRNPESFFLNLEPNFSSSSRAFGILFCRHATRFDAPHQLGITDSYVISQSRTDLLLISKLTNLGVLTIGRNLATSDTGLDDSTSLYHSDFF